MAASSDRLAELQRQRALVQEHLAWIEREIVAADSTSPLSNPTGPNQPAATPAAAKASTPVATASTTENLSADVEALMDPYRVSPVDVQRDVRKGCLLYFVGALILGTGAVIGLYYALRR